MAGRRDRLEADVVLLHLLRLPDPTLRMRWGGTMKIQEHVSAHAGRHAAILCHPDRDGFNHGIAEV